MRTTALDFLRSKPEANSLHFEGIESKRKLAQKLGPKVEVTSYPFFTLLESLLPVAHAFPPPGCVLVRPRSSAHVSEACLSASVLFPGIRGTHTTPITESDKSETSPFFISVEGPVTLTHPSVSLLEPPVCLRCRTKAPHILPHPISSQHSRERLCCLPKYQGSGSTVLWGSHEGLLGSLAK